MIIGVRLWVKGTDPKWRQGCHSLILFIVNSWAQVVSSCFSLKTALDYLLQQWWVLITLHLLSLCLIQIIMKSQWQSKISSCLLLRNYYNHPNLQQPSFWLINMELRLPTSKRLHIRQSIIFCNHKAFFIYSMQIFTYNSIVYQIEFSVV
jgi:hypothetical protein